MRKPQITSAHVISLVALFVALSSSAYAATGGSLILGSANTADKQTGLTAAATGGAALKVTNTASQPAAGFNTPAGIAPFAVSNTTKVAKLNADLFDGKDSTAFLGKTAKAADSDKLDGLDSTAFLPSSGTAANSESLDGFDSSDFVQGFGTTGSHAKAIQPGFSDTTYIGPQGSVALLYACPSTLTDSGFLQLVNFTGGQLNVFTDTGDPNPGYVLLANGVPLGVPTAANGDTITFHIVGNLGGRTVGTIFVNTVNRTTDCHFQAQGLFTDEG